MGKQTMDAPRPRATQRRATGDEPAGGGGEDEVAAILGEIHTGLVQSSAALTPDEARDLLTLIPRTPVRTWERPIRHAASAVRLDGVDSGLPSASRTATRAVGTVETEARITSGRVLQVCSRTTVVPARQRRRLPWSHYLSRPGVLEAWGIVRPDDLVDGFTAPDTSAGELDLGGIAAHVMGELQRSRPLDRAAPFRASRTRLRWAVVPCGDDEAPEPCRVSFVLESPSLRTLRVTGASPAVIEGLPELCQDVARHDWLLSTVLALVDVADIGQRDRTSVLERLQPVVNHLLHAWMPAARLPEDVQPIWLEIERRTGLERQWDSVVRRIRDQMALASALLAPIRER